MSFLKTKRGLLFLLLVIPFVLVACGSSAVKQRKEQRDKIIQSSKMFCEFVNGEVYSGDVDVALNIEMAKKCDNEKPFTVTQYKTPSESQGLIYCCTLANKQSARRKAPIKSEKKETSVDEDADSIESVEETN